MQRLSEITEQLASSVMMADAADLPGLAQLHEQLCSLERAVDELHDLGETRGDSIRQTASSAGKLVEQIVLREVDDASAALQQVSEAIAQLQKLVNAPASEDPLPTAGPAEPRAQAPTPVDAPSAPCDAAAAAPQTDTAINPDDVPLVMEFITESLGHIESAEIAVLQLEEDPQDAEAVNAIFRGFHTIKGVAGFLNLKQIGALAHAAESLLVMVRQGTMKLEGQLVDLILQAIDILKAMIGSLSEAAKNNTAPASHPELPQMLKRLQAAVSGEAHNEAAPQDEPSHPGAPAPQQSAAAAGAQAPEHGTGAGKAAHASGEGTVKVATDRLDSLINMVGELVIAQSMVSQDVNAIAASNQRLGRHTAHLAKITRELQDLSMSMRMVPIQGVFQKMARLVRDLAHKAHKEIDFSVVGGETELDRNVVEAIGDPLVHMVRNSVDHGIEPADVRQRSGKPRCGRVGLKAYHQAGNIVIEISDDGRGLNKAKLLKKAVEAGIVREGEELSEQEIFKLIFHAGLSTAEKITDISGRGVGMDVVKRNVEALRGRIDITSVEGKGTTFIIRLPLTLAVIDGQIVQVGKERYILPITSIEQSIQPRAEQLSTVQDRGEMCLVRGNLLPLFRLYRLFNVQPRTEDPTRSLVVIVQDDQNRCCLLVDELLGQQQVVIKSLGETLGQVPGISGGAILGDGNVSLILDIPGLIQMATGGQA